MHRSAGRLPASFVTPPGIEPAARLISGHPLCFGATPPARSGAYGVVGESTTQQGDWPALLSLATLPGLWPRPGYSHYSTQLFDTFSQALPAPSSGGRNHLENSPSLPVRSSSLHLHSGIARLVEACPLAGAVPSVRDVVVSRQGGGHGRA